jgi:tRNA threonylcarbamoyladenosine biosynthesis protein TsaE
VKPVHGPGAVPDTQDWSCDFAFESSSPSETKDLARSIGSVAADGLVVLLYGPLGAGKTVFAQGLLEGLGITGRVASPTFTLINEYRGRLGIWHIDLYRLEDESEFLEIGGDELLFGGRGVVVVEWADRLRETVPPEHLSATLAYPEQPEQPGDCRQLHLRAHGASLQPVARAIEQWLESRTGRCRS